MSDGIMELLEMTEPDSNKSKEHEWVYPTEGEEFQFYVDFIESPVEVDDAWNRIIDCPRSVSHVLSDFGHESMCNEMFGDEGYPTSAGLWDVKVKATVEEDGNWEEGYWTYMAFEIISSEKIG